MVAAACCEARALVIDLQQTPLMKLLKPDNLLTGVRRTFDLNASGKRVAPKYVTPVPQRLQDHPRDTIVSHRPPDHATAPVEIEKIREPAVDAQILRGIANRTFEQSHELKSDVGQFSCDAQYPVETIEFSPFYGGHIYQDAEVFRQRARRTGNKSRRKRHQFAGDPQRPHFSHHPFRFCPVIQMTQYPWIRFPLEDFRLFVKRIASQPVHHDSLLAQGVRNPEKFALRDAATELINQVARSYFTEHRRKIPNTFIRIVAKLPAVGIHEVGKDWPKIDKPVNEHAADGSASRHSIQHRSFSARRANGAAALAIPPALGVPCCEHERLRRCADSGANDFFPALMKLLPHHVTGVCLRHGLHPCVIQTKTAGFMQRPQILQLTFGLFRTLYLFGP